MVCKVCGRTSNNEDANFCYYCGASFREGVDTSFIIKEEDKSRIEEPYNKQKEVSDKEGIFSGFGNPLASNAEGEQDISFGKWLIVMILPFIPVVGIWVFLGLLFLWSFGKRTSVTRKNWARAMLVFSAILLVISSIYMNHLLSDPTFASMFEGLLPK